MLLAYKKGLGWVFFTPADFVDSKEMKYDEDSSKSYKDAKSNQQIRRKLNQRSIDSSKWL